MTIGTNYSNANYIDPALYAQAKVNGLNYNDVVAAKAVGATQTDSFVSNSSEACTDGKDDGKIGFFEGVGNFFKGAAKGLVNGVKGMFLDENGKFSLKNTLKTAVTIGACFIPVAGPYIAGGLCLIGAAKGGVGMLKSVGNAVAADTDAEAKAALQSLGGSTLATGLSVAGLKGSAGAIAKSAGFTNAAGAGSVSKMLSTAKTAAGRGQILSGMKQSFTNYYGSAWSNGVASANGASSLSKNLAGAKAVIKEGAKGTAQNAIGTAKAIKNKATDATNKLSQKANKLADKANNLTGKTGAGNADVVAKKLSTYGNKVTTEQIQEALNNGGKIQVGKKTYDLSQVGDDISYSLQKQAPKPSATSKINEFLNNDPVGKAKAFAKKTAPKTYAKTSEFVQKQKPTVENAYTKAKDFVQNHTPESVTKAVDSAKSFDAKAYINGIEPAQTVDYNAFIAKMVQDVE